MVAGRGSYSWGTARRDILSAYEAAEWESQSVSSCFLSDRAYAVIDIPQRERFQGLADVMCAAGYFPTFEGLRNLLALFHTAAHYASGRQGGCRR
jgi:hypothetical protein